MEEFDPIMELQNDIYLTTFYSGIVDFIRIKEIFSFIREYSVLVNPSKILSLNEIQKAHEYLESKKGFGKVICLV